VEVKLTEFAIKMPSTVPPGLVAFNVTNAGTIEHNFVVVGEGIEKQFDIDLKPGETRSLPIDLPTGTYSVYSPVNDHKARNMQRELRVAPHRSNTAMRFGE